MSHLYNVRLASILFLIVTSSLVLTGCNLKEGDGSSEEQCIEQGQVLQAADVDLKCCSGLSAKTFCFAENGLDNKCSCPSEGTKLCINCGNRECEQGEDECMCPEDCKKSDN
jgi:hypothetical protein